MLWSPKKENIMTLRKKERCSNIELLRIFAMFLVLIVHADFFSLGAPSSLDIKEEGAPISSFVRIFFESLSICAVDIFVLISGWFGIKQSLKGFCKFIFQCLFFLISIYVVCLLLVTTSFTKENTLSCSLLLNSKHWFIKGYIVLYIISPILNLFAEKATQKQFAFVIINFFIFQTIYAWLTNAASFFVDGYSPLSFIGLYLLARYANLYPHHFFCRKKEIDFSIYLIIAFFMAIMVFFRFFPFFSNKMFYYTNPLVIIASLYVLLFFSKLQIQNKIVNWIAISSFSVFLLHTSYHTTNFFKSQNQYIFNHYDGIACLSYFFVFLLFCFFTAIFFDKIRIFSWNKLCLLYKKILQRK